MIVLILHVNDKVYLCERLNANFHRRYKCNIHKRFPLSIYASFNATERCLTGITHDDIFVQISLVDILHKQNLSRNETISVV